jgi:hypothetical protein
VPQLLGEDELELVCMTIDEHAKKKVVEIRNHQIEAVISSLSIFLGCLLLASLCAWLHDGRCDDV